MLVASGRAWDCSAFGGCVCGFCAGCGWVEIRSGGRSGWIGPTEWAGVLLEGGEAVGEANEVAARGAGVGAGGGVEGVEAGQEAALEAPERLA